MSKGLKKLKVAGEKTEALEAEFRSLGGPGSEARKAFVRQCPRSDIQSKLSKAGGNCMKCASQYLIECVYFLGMETVLAGRNLQTAGDGPGRSRT
jgi:hypothetical protein